MIIKRGLSEQGLIGKPIGLMKPRHRDSNNGFDGTRRWARLIWSVDRLDRYTFCHRSSKKDSDGTGGWVGLFG